MSKIINTNDEENYFVPQRKSLVNLETHESLFKFIDISNAVINSMSSQFDLYFKKYKFSGNFPIDYISNRNTKPVFIDAFEKFFDPRFPAIENYSNSYGFLAEIDRNWVFLENTVYFWNPANKKSLFICYPIDVKVEEIFLIPLFPNDFIVKNSSNIFHFIIIFNAIHLIKCCLASLQYDDDNNFSDFSINLNSFVVINNKFNITSFKCTKNSRAFFGASNQNIYELKYNVTDSKITCSLIDVTSNSLLFFIPSVVVNILEANSIIQIEIFDNILYALDSKFNIHIFEINDNFNKFTKIDTLKFCNIDKQCSDILGKINFFNMCTIISIHACSPTASHIIQLIVVFSNGFRAYITSSSDSNNDVSSSYLNYRVVHLRKPPFDDISEIKNVYSVFMNHDNFIICTSYGNEYRLWCTTRSLRCNSDILQESLTIYSLERPIIMLQERKLTSLVSPIPFLTASCNTPKSLASIQLADFLKFNNILGFINETEFINVNIKKCYEILLSIYQMKNYQDSKEFMSYAAQSTDIEFNLASFTVLGKVKLSEENIALNILGDLWDSSFLSEVHFINGMIYKKTNSSDRINQPEGSNYVALHADLKNFQIEGIDILRSNPISLLLYSFMIHFTSHFSPIWNSRILLYIEDQKWKSSINLHDIKIYQISIDELLLCIKRLITFYRCKLNNPAFIETRLFHRDLQVDFESDLKILERLEYLAMLTYQWLYIWMGITAVDPDKFFMHPNVIGLLKTLNFSDLIFKNIEISDRITWKFISYIMDKPKVFEFFINKWPLDANLYFSDELREIAIANQKLVEATRSTFIDVRNQNLQTCLDIYSKNHSYLDLGWICEILIKMNFHPNAITLCLHISDSFSKYEPLAHDDDVIHFRLMRNKMAETIFMILNDSYYKYKNISNRAAWDQTCEHGSDFHSKNFRCTILAVLESAKDQFLSYKIFDWMLNNDFSAYLVKSNSVFLSEYLNDVDFGELSLLDLKKARCLYDIYESDHNFSLAALQLYRIATSNIKIQPQDGDLGEYLSLDERLDYLQISLAQISLVGNSQENTTLISNIKKKIQLLNLQLKVVDELRDTIKNSNVSEADSYSFAYKRLVSNILPLKNILETIVIPCDLITSYLLLAKVLGTDVVDQEYLIKIWCSLFYNVCQILTSSASKNIQTDYLNKFKETLKEYSKIDFCFPIQRLIYEFSCIIMKTKLENLFLPELFSTTGILPLEEYCYFIQENIFQLTGSFKKDFGIIKTLFYLMDTYVDLCEIIFKDRSKTTFANTVKMFNDYLQTKTMALKVDPIDLQKYQNKIYTISDMLLKFYENL